MYIMTMRVHPREVPDAMRPVEVGIREEEITHRSQEKMVK